MRIVIFLMFLHLGAVVAAAQGLFAPVAVVDERPVTAFERDQRAIMLRLFRTAGDLEAQALESLVDERLQLAEAARLGIEVTADEIADGQTEFAARANLTAEEFTATLAEAGVAPESFADFVRAGVAWRKTVRARFGGRITIPEQQIDRAARQEPRPELRVLLSEIILPANTPENAARSRALLDEITRISTLAGFARAAREYSASPSRDRGGRIDWIPVGNLPPTLRDRVTSLGPGELTPPLDIPNAIAIFQLRAIEETDAEGEVTEVDYAALYLPGGRSAEALAEAEAVRQRVDSCDDLYGVARGLPPERLERAALAPSQVPGDVALELARLDPGEASTNLTRAGGRTLVFLMLCDRSYADPEADGPSRDRIRDVLIERRASSAADAYLAELRANAHIVYP